MPAGALLQNDTAETWVPWEFLRCGRGPRAGFLGELFALACGVWLACAALLWIRRGIWLGWLARLGGR